ncbi:hypothetical protein BDC45DRAFT_203717 [Circinella umbellata]|nr:hypothetical protein BDC45DRAFT_203717 [Circinella umbellata]
MVLMYSKHLSVTTRTVVVATNSSLKILFVVGIWRIYRRIESSNQRTRFESLYINELFVLYYITYTTIMQKLLLHLSENDDIGNNNMRKVGKHDLQSKEAFKWLYFYSR